jgi:hypothetical protein
MFPLNLDLPLNTKNVHIYITEFWKNLGIFGTLVFKLGIFVHNRQNKALVPNSSKRDNLSFLFQVGYQVARNLCIGMHIGVMNPRSLELSTQNSWF